MAREALRPEAHLARLGAQADSLIRSSRRGRIIGRKRPELKGLAGDQVFHVHARSELYRISEEVAPHARDADLEELGRRMRLQASDLVVDVAAGTGFVSGPVARETNNTVYAFDTSRAQLDVLTENTQGLPVLGIEDSFATDTSLARLGSDRGRIDVVTSLAGIHHITAAGQQEQLFINAAQALRPGGRFVGGDVGDNTPLQRFFDEVVTAHCITGHDERWLSPERIKHELIPGTGLNLVSAEITQNHEMVFDSEEHMLLWTKALLALDMKKKELKEKLRHILTYRNRLDGKIALSWNLLFFEAVKPDPPAAV